MTAGFLLGFLAILACAEALRSRSVCSLLQSRPDLDVTSLNLAYTVLALLSAGVGGLLIAGAVAS